ncbi:putative Permease of the drug/metabolite transporter (DMT) superfamily [Vibrio crassostreae]|uniref:Putative Permease of the drug/metabolite transporter (DMT) superfamily n=2 Tax=Vibrio crassostreae TaxID=246167 RepID=A0A822MYQ7_9VIBR|nr:drug/metabolite transporter (DMT)-like permease [Vibrio crassostreae]TCT57823.1 drug/metabolite transporter (DMT)-like permease [Vibrio crassostreae]TCT77955.1 drug/metabolite transporter (DMT)-like permease [Vibrio crassostreae]TCU00042.1 drug/metabolite transporter (DMT)-like permease [Vibrio crassostreae]TCU04918.1 drug/metabolite transporter (DMT)-like permease [Vibrio crassostreae]
MSFLKLIMLAAIWGGSFLFMRIAANPLGPAVLIEARVLCAAVTLLLVSFYLKRKLSFNAHAKHFFILGLFNTALPFLFFAYAAQTLNASTLAILNSTAPIWAAIIGAIWTKTTLEARVLLGLGIGVTGVGVLVGWDAMNIGQEAILPIFAAVMAAFSYGIASNYTKQAPKVEAFNNAHGSMWAAVLIVLPFVFFIPMQEAPNLTITMSVILLGAVCTGLAYLLYFNLINELGAPSALSVTFLIPVFGILWGNLFLDEAIGINTVVGSILVITGTMLVTGMTPSKMIEGAKQKRAARAAR